MGRIRNKIKKIAPVVATIYLFGGVNACAAKRIVPPKDNSLRNSIKELKVEVDEIYKSFEHQREVDQKIIKEFDAAYSLIELSYDGEAIAKAKTKEALEKCVKDIEDDSLTRIYDENKGMDLADLKLLLEEKMLENEMKDLATLHETYERRLLHPFSLSRKKLWRKVVRAVKNDLDKLKNLRVRVSGMEPEKAVEKMGSLVSKVSGKVSLIRAIAESSSKKDLRNTIACYTDGDLEKRLLNVYENNSSLSLDELKCRVIDAINQ